MNTLNIPKKPTERWEWIKYQLRLKGSSLSAIAREQKVSRNAVHNVARVPYPRMERAIANKLGVSPIKLWPERWNADGTPKRQRPNQAEQRVFNASQSSEVAGLTHRQPAGGY